MILFRLGLAAAPFVIWFIWRERALRAGREMGATPWAWLVCAGGVLLGASLMASALFHADNRDEVYVPAQVQSDGRVSPGRYEPRVPAR